MPNAAPRPWRMFLPLAIVLLIALLWTVYWFIASGIARERFEAERTRLAGQGLTLACTEESWGGYPFHFEYACRSPILRQEEKAELRSADLLLVALAYAPWQVAALLDGPTTIAAEGIVPTRIEHERALAAVTFGKEGQTSVSAEMPAVSVPSLGGAGKLMLHTRPSSGGGTDVAVTLTKLSYAPPGKPPIAVDDGSLLGTLATDGTFRIDSFELKQGQLRYWGSGTLSLDPSRRIAGQVDTETNDIKALLAMVGPHLDLSDGQLANLRTMLGLLGNAAKAPIIAKDGVLYLGPFKVADLRPLY